MGHIYADIDLANQKDLALASEGHIAQGEVRRRTVRVMVEPSRPPVTVTVASRGVGLASTTA